MSFASCNMFPLSFLIRTKYVCSSTPIQLKKLLSTLHNNSGSTDSSDDEREPKKTKQTKNKDALNRLNILLQSMVKEESTLPSPSELDKKIAKPKGHFKKKQISSDTENKATSPETRSVGDALTDAAKQVAESLGGNIEQTESELLNKLRSHTVESGKPNGRQEVPKPSINLSELIVGMKIDRSPKASEPAEQGRAQHVRMILSNQQGQRGREKHYEPRFTKDKRQDTQRPKTHIGKVDLFGGEPLGIFRPLETTAAVAAAAPITELSLWKWLQERELRLALTHPPANIFEEMILWTQQGKMWKFPIDNEQGLEDNSKVYFTEHVFLEPHLEPWCPRRGPVRHFMELVCVGLSKNPYISAQDKRDHIMWFQQYFEQKKDLLKEVGALDSEPDSSKQKVIAA